MKCMPLDSATFLTSKLAQTYLTNAPRTVIWGLAARRDFLLPFLLDLDFLDFLDFFEPLLERLLDLDFLEPLRDDLREALLILRLERLLDFFDDLRDNFLLDLDLRLLPPS